MHIGLERKTFRGGTAAVCVRRGHVGCGAAKAARTAAGAPRTETRRGSVGTAAETGMRCGARWRAARQGSGRIRGITFAGPCVIFQNATTAVMPEGLPGPVDAFGNLLLARGA